MSLSNEIVLRPRFQIDMDCDSESAIARIKEMKEQTDTFKITIVDDHVFIKIPKDKQHFWSPQLDLQFQDKEENESGCTLFGLFGPKPAVWTMFMFLHFVVASLFIAFGIWAYTNASLDSPYVVQLFLMGLMVIGWFVLYFAGRMGKTAGRDEMISQYQFMKHALNI